MMAGQIIVLLRGSDRVELFLPYVEQIAQPGMKVVFLVPLGLRGFKELIGQLVATGIRAACLPERICKEDVVEHRRLSAEQQVDSACPELRARGVKFEVHVCGGPLQRIVEDYLKKENVHLIMLRPSHSWIAEYLRKLGWVFRFLKPPVVPPVLLLHPSNIGER
jgi:hypothetical protein